MAGRSSADRRPICLRMAVSSPFLPRYFTRRFSSAVMSSACKMASTEASRSFCSISFMQTTPSLQSLHSRSSLSPDRGIKKSSRPAYRDERKLPRYHPNSAHVRRTLCALTGGPAGDWPELTGERSTFLAGRSQPAASLSGAEPWYYFPDPSNKLNNKAIYTTLRSNKSM